MQSRGVAHGHVLAARHLAVAGVGLPVGNVMGPVAGETLTLPEKNLEATPGLFDHDLTIFRAVVFIGYPLVGATKARASGGGERKKERERGKQFHKFSPPAA